MSKLTIVCLCLENKKEGVKTLFFLIENGTLGRT